MSIIDQVNQYGNAITALATIGTLIVAFLVFHEARSIRRTRWILNQNQAWNHFSEVVASQPTDSRVGAILSGDDFDGKLSSQESFVLMMFFNVVNSEFSAYRAGAISRHWVLYSFGMTISIVRGNQKWVIPFLEKYGYEETFIRVIALLPRVPGTLKHRKKFIRNELIAASWWGKLLGERYRTWLLQGYADVELEELLQ